MRKEVDMIARIVFLFALGSAGMLSGCVSMEGSRQWVDADIGSAGSETSHEMGGGFNEEEWFQEGEEEDEPGFIHRLIFYLPNRVLDLIDIFRLRLRVGPGFGVGARATEAIDVYFGGYASVWVGLPGPRNRKLPKLPIGLESKSGVELSVVDASIEGGIGPDYGPGELGADVQLLVVGVAVGVDPVDALDFLLGILTLDLRGDDF